MKVKPNLRLVAVLASMALLAAACGGGSADATATTAATTTTTAAETTTTAAMTGMNVGPGCGAVPMDGEGSFAGMADDPAATAASNNPVLSTLVAAVSEAGLVDTLNGAGPFTIFAPTNDAFAAIPEADLNAILADQELLTSILTYHVVGGESLDLAALAEAGSITTINGADLSFAAVGDVIEVNGVAATICGNVQTANAAVHI
ncbi:MAG: fasciclin domain-containing protein, partial [Acidimicrobiia bacterium]